MGYSAHEKGGSQESCMVASSTEHIQMWVRWKRRICIHVLRIGGSQESCMVVALSTSRCSLGEGGGPGTVLFSGPLITTASVQMKDGHCFTGLVASKKNYLLLHQGIISTYLRSNYRYKVHNKHTQTKPSRGGLG